MGKATPMPGIPLHEIADHPFLEMQGGTSQYHSKTFSYEMAFNVTELVVTCFYDWKWYKKRYKMYLIR